MSQIASHRLLGPCWLVYGILRLVAAIGLALYWGTATVMFGALLNRVANPFTLMDLFHIFYVLAIVWCVIGGVLGIIAGMAFMASGQPGRRTVILAALVALPDSPLGVMLGTYTLIIFLPGYSPARNT